TILSVGHLNNRQRNFCQLHITNATEPGRQLSCSAEMRSKRMNLLSAIIVVLEFIVALLRLIGLLV
ncbi:hypothetical protein, partial [Yersinia mollaretii]|uniref:hypothetical protein n=1 Tax=Yersinia mollaretii TaxID=33060 RepID=UPI001C97A0C9